MRVLYRSEKVSNLVNVKQHLLTVPDVSIYSGGGMKGL